MVAQEIKPVVKNQPANVGDLGLIPGPRRFPAEGNDNSLQYSYLGNPMDRVAWQAAAHGVAKNEKCLSAKNNNDS